MVLKCVRNVGNLCNGSTLLGIVLGFVGRGYPTMREHLLVFDRVRLPLISASAMTVGSVVLILGRRLEEAEERIPELLAHEEEHAWQWAACLGLPFIPLYLAATVWSLIRTGDRAAANYFEMQAGLERGGYVKATQRKRRAERSA